MRTLGSAPILGIILAVWLSSALAGPLHDAAKNGDLEQLKQLLDQGTDIEEQDRFVGTALHWAAITGNAEVAQVLIAAGADVNSVARGDGTTALHVAAKRGSIEVAAALIEAGAETEARENAKCTPLYQAAGNDRVGVAALLLDAGADINAGCHSHPTHPIGSHGPSSTESSPLAPLHMAAISNASRAIELLVRSGADIDEKMRTGATSLSLAVFAGQADAVRTLVELGADVNGVPDVDPVLPSTPLKLAITSGLEEIADILRAAGATE